MRSSFSWLPIPGVCFALALALGVVACGGAASSELFDPSTGTDAGDHPDTSTGAHDSSTPPPTDSGMVMMVDSTIADTNLPDTTVQIDSSPPELGITCGAGLTCNKSQFCCATSDPLMINPTMYACMDSSQTGSCTSAGGTPVTCDFGSNCTGTDDLCCGTLNTDQTVYTHVRCATTCGTTDDRTFCDPNAVPDLCTGGMMCGPSTILTGFSVCQ
jgi:hypothetical protein